MKIIHTGFDQRSLEWERVRCGKLTGSNVDKILTPAKLEFSTQSLGLAKKIAAERIKGKPEESVITSDMQRGTELEPEARYQFETNYMPVEEVAFVENSSFGFPFGCSPDGLIDGRKAGIEIKCPSATQHLSTVLYGEISGGYMLQMQSNMMCADADYWFFVSYHEGLIMRPIRVRRDEKIIAAIAEAGKRFEDMVQTVLADYYKRQSESGVIATELPKEIE